MGNTLYGLALDNDNNQLIFAVDPTSQNNTQDIVRAPNTAFPPLLSPDGLDAQAITNDGSAFYVAGEGYLWRVTRDGEISYAAGAGQFGIGTGLGYMFSAGYDPTASHSAADVELLTATLYEWGTTTGNVFVTYHDGAVYFRGHAGGMAAYVEKILCP
jgi:hypothetical protein